jgi:hypothetical protein
LPFGSEAFLFNIEDNEGKNIIQNTSNLMIGEEKGLSFYEGIIGLVNTVERRRQRYTTRDTQRILEGNPLNG